MVEVIDELTFENDKEFSAWRNSSHKEKEKNPIKILGISRGRKNIVVLYAHKDWPISTHRQRFKDIDIV
jgi:hypothetical protein